MFGVLLTLIFIRPFISSLAFPYLNLIYSTILLGYLVIWLIQRGFPIEKVRTLRLPFLLFLVALLISIISSTDKINSLNELYKYVSAILVFLVAISLNYEHKMRIINTIILAGFLISLLAIYQYFFGFEHILEYISKEKITDPFAFDYIQRRRVFFPFVTPNILAGYLIIMIPLTLINRNRVWFIIPISFALLLTKSLGALLSIFLASVIYFYLQGKLEKRKIIFLLGLLVVMGLVFITRITTQKQHLQPIFSTVMRLNYWKDTLSLIKANPLTGVGIGNFNLIQSRYAHNSYLQIWAELGILGLIGWLGLIFKSFQIGFKKLKASKNQTYIIAGLLSANMAFLIHNLVDFSFFLPEVSLIWWIILGLCSE